MTVDPHDEDFARPGGPGEEQLRKALGTVNDLEPPRDDLFVQRAILRGRARSARRRSVLLGAAAVLVVGGAIGGGTWLVQNSTTGTSGTSAASGANAPERANDAATGGKASPSAQGLAPSAPSAGSPAVPPAGDPSRWFAGAATAQTAAFAAIEPQLESVHSDVFSGAYAADASNTRIVVALTRPDPTVQSLVRSAMPSPDDVAFVTAAHSIGEKERLVAQIQADAPAWQAAGVTLIGLRLDGRTDRVVVTADEGPSPGWVAARYGPVVTVVP
ncbi:hypothetical protein N865_02750 [Intrasporangium oryzae NRRL B-24470]|uniref:Uncharacterized protein n=1 Tax=Intrasporangium oryzae NRRL B-24470 TaxID=1386089 RepID=W9G9B0_9MICO|nr:hypothetical protein [Intrasporangium oryzae]EWT02625.1 hypothetical protein N865_02750 [Intrasporangium oryzae NRRL B-24470]